MRRGTIEDQQLELLEKARRYISEKDGSLNAQQDPNLFLCSWADSIGNGRLRGLAYGWRSLSLLFYRQAVDIYGFLKGSPLKLSSFPIEGSRFESVVLSWGKASDFDSNGGFNDRYFKTSSAATPNVLWLILSIDSFTPPKPCKNLVVLTTGKVPSFRTVLTRAWSLINCFFRPFYSPVSLPSQLSDIVVRLVNRHQIGCVVMPYEAQPFQHAVVERIRRDCVGVESVGYLHSALPSLPSDLIRRSGAPGRLLVHGIGQKDILVNFLGWSESSITTIPALRYRVTDFSLAGNILLPYAFRNSVLLLKRLEGYLVNAPFQSMPIWKIRNHPVMAYSSKHKDLIAGIQHLLQKHSNRMAQKEAIKQQCIIFGATAAVVEALEQNLDVIHVCSEPLFEAHVSGIWGYISVEILSAGVYRYSLTKHGRYIQHGRKDYNLLHALSYIG